MINQLNDIGLLVFDMDGTIMPSSKPTCEAIKRAFRKLNPPSQISDFVIDNTNWEYPVMNAK